LTATTHGRRGRQHAIDHYELQAQATSWRKRCAKLRTSVSSQETNASHQQIQVARASLRGAAAVLSEASVLPFFFGYRVGKRVRIGVSILEAGVCEIGDDAQIGHLNVVIGVKQ